LKTTLSNTLHLATFIDIVSIQKNPETKKDSAIIRLNLYGNIILVNVPEEIIPIILALDSGDELLVLLKKTIKNEYFLYGIQLLNFSLYN